MAKKRKYIDVKLIRSWKPCYDPCGIVPEDWEGTVMDILTTDKIPDEDKVWLVCHKEIMTKKQCIEFARSCVAYAAAYAIDTAADDAYAAAYATTTAAATTAAVDVAYATTDVAYATAVAAATAARVAERKRQVDFLIKMFKEV